MNLKICDAYSIILVVIYLVSNLMIPLGEGQLEKKMRQLKKSKKE